MTKRIAIAVSAILAWMLILLTIFAFGAYGIAMFIFIPIMIGYTPVALYRGEGVVTKRQARNIGWTNALVVSLGLLVFAIEGIICLVMAAPLIMLFSWIGSTYAINVKQRRAEARLNVIGALAIVVPLLGFLESNLQFVKEHKVVSSVLIDAPKEKVWDLVIAFPPIDDPNDLLFKAGISYPTSASLEGLEPGDIRRCTFNSGDFVEPITACEPNRLLSFTVSAQPPPMRELTIWKVDPPHLNDYLQSKRGQFELKVNEDGTTELIGTTWYQLRMQPVIYWYLWSDMIIHKIHMRVLDHIKAEAEK